MRVTEPVDAAASELPPLLRRICVRPPYFALDDVQFRGSVLTATARADMRIEGERGPMSGAELGRHAAIAGLCCAALSQDDDRRRYYLAQRAECVFEESGAQPGSEVVFRAELTRLDKRTARSRVVAECEGRPLADLDISYTILTEPAFARLFGARRQETGSNLARFQPQLAGNISRDARRAEFKVPEVPLSACTGHFDDFPVLPVAVLMGKLSELAGYVLGAPAVPYRVSRGSVSAKDLCWANDPVTFTARVADICGNETRFDCSATSDGRTVGSMSLFLETA